MPEAKKRPYTTAQLTEKYEAIEGRLDTLDGVTPTQPTIEEIPGLSGQLSTLQGSLASKGDEILALNERVDKLGAWLTTAWIVIWLLGIALVAVAAQAGVFSGWGW